MVIAGRGGSGGVEVMGGWRSNGDRGMAAGCMQVGRLVVVVGGSCVCVCYLVGLCLRLSCRQVACGGEVVVLIALVVWVFAPFLGVDSGHEYLVWEFIGMSVDVA